MYFITIHEKVYFYTSYVNFKKRNFFFFFFFFSTPCITNPYTVSQIQSLVTILVEANKGTILFFDNDEFHRAIDR